MINAKFALTLAVLMLGGCKPAASAAEQGPASKPSASASGVARPGATDDSTDASASAAIASLLPAGQTTGPQTTGDLNGDGRDDIAFIGTGPEGSLLYVALAPDTAAGAYALTSKGRVAADEPGSVDLSIDNGVLKLGFESGGTTQTDATYRLRYVPATKRMRLIGFDATTFDPSLLHDTDTLSWNLLTGAVVRAREKANMNGSDEGAPVAETRTQRVVAPIMLEALPDPGEIDALVAKR